MQPSVRLLATLLMTLVLTACASGGGATPKARKVDQSARDAAALQVKLGQGYLSEGNLETARDKLQRALEMDPNSVDAHTLMAVLNERINRPKMAEQFYRRAVELRPTDGLVNNNLGAFLCGTGRFEEAEAYFRQALDDPFYKTPAVANTNAGVCAVKAGLLDKADEWLRQALAIEPASAIALFELSRIHYLRGDSLRARAFLQRYEASAKFATPEALDLGAQIEAQSGDAAAAAQYRKRLVTEFPDYTPQTVPSETPSP